MPSLLRQLKREAEGGDERWAKESRHLGNLPGKPRTIEGDDMNAGRSIGPYRFVNSIHDKCRLSIGARRIQTPPILHARLEYGGKENGANRFSYLIPTGDRWHTQESGFFQQGHKPGAVICLPPMDGAR